MMLQQNQVINSCVQTIIPNMLVARTLSRAFRFRSLIPLISQSFAKQRLIQFTPQQIEHIHSKAHPKLLDFTKGTSSYYTVCIVGLPNSGKSTLYNCIVGDNLALTDSIPGMTRDRKELFIWNGLVKLIDTAGVETNRIHQDMTKQTIQAYNQADKILLVVDGKSGINENEIQFAKLLKQKGLGDRVVLVVNKMESIDETELSNDIYKLGFKNIMYTSGEHGNGVLELMQYIDSCIPAELKLQLEEVKRRRKENFKKVINQIKEEIRKEIKPEDSFSFKNWEKEFRKLNPDPEDNSQLDEQPSLENFTRPQESFGKGRGVSDNNPMLKKPIQISIIGRPNVGKSSLINKLLGQNRMMVSQIAHTTTDSIINEFQYKGRKVKLVDTAGLNSSNFDSNQEHLKKTQIAAMNHVKYSHVIIYMIDSDSSIRNLDFTFIKRIIEEGRPVVLAINKWETIKHEYRKKALAYIDKQIETNLGELNGMPVIPVSAIMEEGVDSLMDSVFKMYDQWNLRVSTGMLNNWLQKFSKLQNLPRDGCQNLRIRFLVQAKVRPPTFIIFVNNKQLFKQNYQRFMKDKMVDEFHLQGIPVRFITKNAGGEEKKQNSETYKEYKKKKQTIKVFQRKQKMEELKSKYGDFGKKE